MNPANERPALGEFLEQTGRPPGLSGIPALPTGGSKLYRGAPRVHLTPPGACSRRSGDDLQRLSDLLFFSFGVNRLRHAASDRKRRSEPLRPVASGGALFPCELYVAHQGLARLGDGLSHFDPLHHQLEVLAWGWVPASSPDASTPPTALTVFLTLASWKSAARYQAFSLRLMLLELGILAEQLLLIGSFLGMQVSSVQKSGPAVRTLLRLGESELPGLQLSFSWPAGPAFKPSPSPRTALEWTAAVHRPDWRPGLQEFPVAWALEEAIEDESAACATGIDAPQRRQLWNQDETSFSHARRSCQQGFRSVDFPQDRLIQILRQACPPPPTGQVPALRFIVVARHVEGLKAGGYQFGPAEAALLPLEHADASCLLRGGLPDGLPQSSHPAAWLYLTAELPQQGGCQAHRYWRLQVEVGRSLQRIQLTCAANRVDSHISLAYDAAGIHHHLGLPASSWVAAQVLLGQALPETESLEVLLHPYTVKASVT